MSEQVVAVVAWNDPSLACVTKLRLVSNSGDALWWVEYCKGLKKDGTEVRVHLPFFWLWKRYEVRREFIGNGYKKVPIPESEKKPTIKQQVEEYVAKHGIEATINFDEAISTYNK